MKKHFVMTFLIILAPFLLVSCVSSLLKEKPPSFSKDIMFTSPQDPFSPSTKSIFPSWKNKQTGNVISIFSDCQNESPKNLTELQKYIEDSLENGTRIQESIKNFQNKPALHVLIHGELESNPISIQSISFIRDDCGYVVYLSGKPQQLQLDQITFDQFLASLKFK